MVLQSGNLFIQMTFSINYLLNIERLIIYVFKYLILCYFTTFFSNCFKAIGNIAYCMCIG